MFFSDRDLKGDIAEVPDDDSEGHAFYSDRDLKDDIAEVPNDDSDDTEGHGGYAGLGPRGAD